MTKKLGKNAIQEICLAMSGLRGTPSKQMAERLAKQHGVKKARIYEITRHLRPERKTRKDKGNRTFELKEGTDLWFAAAHVLGGKLDPDQALETAKANGYTNLPSLEYFQRILRENGLGKEQRKSSKRPHRNWEADLPGEIIQIDVTALKVRWEDEKTRRILRIEGIDKNHPDAGKDKIRVWQIMAVDDHSRRRFLRYVATTHITSRDMVEFCCDLFDTWGVPQSIYSDNGSEFKGYFIRAEKLLNIILEDRGGFKHERHLPRNAQATGKVEVAHKWAEKMDRYIGLAINKGIKVEFENLNPFADNICHFYNSSHVHRRTKMTPDSRWHSKRVLVTTLPKDIIESALLSDEFEAKLNDDVTVAHKGVFYQLPGEQPFVNWIGEKISLVIPMNLDVMLITLPDNSTHEVPKIIATADSAGDFKSHEHNQTQQLKKALKTTFKEDNKRAKKQLKQTGEEFQVPHYNADVALPETNVAHFPHKEVQITPEEIEEAIPNRVPKTVYKGKQIKYWEAVGMFADKFTKPAEAREFLRTVFADDEVLMTSKKVEEIIDNRNQDSQPTKLRIVS